MCSSIRIIMFIIYYNLLFCVITANSTLNQVQYDLSNECINSLILNINSYQLTIFVNITKLDDFMQLDKFIRSIVQQIPSVKIDPMLMQMSHNNPLFLIPVLQNSRQSSIHLILYYKFYDDEIIHLNNLKYYIDLFSQIAPRPMRPKCLIVFLQDSAVNSTKFFRKILQYGWSKKFLNLCILEVNFARDVNEMHIFIHDFDPFHKNFTKKSFNPDIKIFTDKLVNVNKHPLKLPVYNFPPFMMYQANEKGDVAHVDGVRYHLTNTIIDIMNFSPQYTIKMENNVTIERISREVRTGLDTGDVNMMPVVSSQSIGLANTFPEIHVNFYYVTFVAAVPVLQDSKFRISLHDSYYLFIITLIIIFFFYIMKKLDVTEKQLKFFYLLQIVLGLPVKKLPKKTINRIFLACIIFTSMIYTSVIYSQVVNAQIIKEDIPFDTIKEIYESKLTTFIEKKTFEEIMKTVDYSYNEYMYNMKSKMNTLPSIITCFDNLQKHQNCICITTFERADMIIKEHLKISKKSMMKIAKPIFFNERSSYIVEQGCPYMKKFSQIFQIVEESGIRQYQDNIQKNKKIIWYEKQENAAETFDVELLIIILITGHMISVIVLFLEICFHMMA